MIGSRLHQIWSSSVSPIESYIGDHLGDHRGPWKREARFARLLKFGRLMHGPRVQPRTTGWREGWLK